MPDKVAGHTFVQTERGEACADCGKLWLDVLNARELWTPGATGIAHTGALNVTEIAELQAKLERIWNAGMRF